MKRCCKHEYLQNLFQVANNYCVAELRCNFVHVSYTILGGHCSRKRWQGVKPKLHWGWQCMERDGHTHLQFLALVGSHRAFPGVFLPSFRMSCQHLCSSDFFFLCVCVCVCVSTFIWNSGFIAATIGCANADGTTSGMDQHCTKIWTDWRHSVKD